MSLQRKSLDVKEGLRRDQLTFVNKCPLCSNTGMSLQYRKLEVQEAIHPDAAARMTHKMAEDSKNQMSRIKAVCASACRPWRTFVQVV